jgi:C4-dicarboxylate-binding protein DctP
MISLRQICLLLACLVLVPVSAGAEPVKIRITLTLPITNHMGVNLAQFKAEVEKQSRGELTFEIFDNSRLYRDNQTLDAVASGAIEMGSVGISQLVNKMPALDIFGQPFLFNFDALIRAGTDPDGDIRQVLDKAVLERFGVRVLWMQPNGTSVFVSKGYDARTPAAIRGRKVRVFANNVARFVRYCGGDPLNVSASKQYDAVKDGLVDILITGIASVPSRGLWKVLDTVTRTEHGALEYTVIINEKVWQSLSDNHKAIITAAAKKVERELRQSMADVEAKAYAFVRAKGMKVHELTPNEVAEWRACSAGIIDEYMSTAGDIAAKTMAAYGKLRTLPCCSAGPKGEFTLR